MNAIECHYNFGKLFRLHSVQGESKKKATKAVEMPAKKEEKAEDKPADNSNPTPTPAEDATVIDNDNEGEDTTKDGEDNEQDNEQDDNASTEGADTDTELKQVTVSDLAAAKDYLADKFGISRTTLRSKKAIVEQAAANGIEFVGLS